MFTECLQLDFNFVNCQPLLKYIFLILYSVAFWSSVSKIQETCLLLEKLNSSNFYSFCVVVFLYFFTVLAVVPGIAGFNCWIRWKHLNCNVVYQQQGPTNWITVLAGQPPSGLLSNSVFLWEFFALVQRSCPSMSAIYSKDQSFMLVNKRWQWNMEQVMSAAVGPFGCVNRNFKWTVSSATFLFLLGLSFHPEAQIYSLAGIWLPKVADSADLQLFVCFLHLSNMHGCICTLYMPLLMSDLNFNSI